MSDIYRELVIDHYKHPRNFGELTDADFSGQEDNIVCGDTVAYFLKMNDGKVVEAKWKGEGCALSQASASLLSEMLIGKTLEELAKIDKNAVLEKIGPALNPSREKCATLSIEALHKIITKKHE